MYAIEPQMPVSGRAEASHALMVARIGRELIPHRGPGLSIDQRRMLAGVELVFVGNLTGVDGK
jgi:hypothetical protein